MHRSSAQDLVLRSLYAISAQKEAEFYATLFQNQEPERFAMIIIDPRCLLNPLLKSLISDLKILFSLDLTPLLVVGALGEDLSQVRYYTQKLAKELEVAGIQYGKLNCASYEFAPHVKKMAQSGKFPVLELTDTERGLDLIGLVTTFRPAKIIMLQPSGGVRENGRRVPVIKAEQIQALLSGPNISDAQVRAFQFIQTAFAKVEHHCTYVLASPLNLLAELFTVKGSGTMVRRTAQVKSGPTYRKFKKPLIAASIESAFGRTLAPDFIKRKPSQVFMEMAYRGGAIFSDLGGLPYMSKFWVTPEAQGEGIAHDIWQAIESDIPAFFWRSKKDNPFNDWYMKICDGMQVSGAWRVFWKGLQAPEIPAAILAASNAPIDFE